MEVVLDLEVTAVAHIVDTFVLDPMSVSVTPPRPFPPRWSIGG